MQSIFILSDEEQCALTDIAHFGSVDAVAQAFRDKLLIKLAMAATYSLSGQQQNQEHALAVQFLHLLPSHHLKFSEESK